MKVYFWTLAAAFAGVFSLATTLALASSGMIPAWLT